MTVDLFPSFRDVMIDGEGATIHCRIGGDGPAVLFLHGFPETHATWHRVAGAMAQRFTCVFADLRGYGASSVPAAGPGGIGYSKRAMANDMGAVMARLGHTRFAVVGHDRGARVAYRMAFDHGAAVERLAVVDIVPTLEVWRRIDRGSALALHHWLFLAQPAPYPETFIAAAPDYFLEATLKAWSPRGDLAAFDPAVLRDYRAQMRDGARAPAMCHDYRAGASVDVDLDAADQEARRRITVPTLLIGTQHGFTPADDRNVAVWQRWATDLRTANLATGHFAAEEDPVAVVAALMPFLAERG